MMLFGHHRVVTGQCQTKPVGDLARQGAQIVVARLNIRGVEVLKGALDAAAQEAMVADIRAVAAAAPLFSPETRWGKKMSVAMTSAGK